jgi:hypothetical protein
LKSDVGNNLAWNGEFGVCKAVRQARRNDGGFRSWYPQFDLVPFAREGQ